MLKNVKKKWWDIIKRNEKKDVIVKKIIDSKLDDEFWINMGIPSSNANFFAEDISRLNKNIELEMIKRNNLVKPEKNSFNNKIIQMSFANDKKQIIMASRNDTIIKKIAQNNGFEWNWRERHWQKNTSKIKTRSKEDQIRELGQILLNSGYGITTLQETMVKCIQSVASTKRIEENLFEIEKKQKRGVDENERISNSESVQGVFKESQTTTVSGNSKSVENNRNNNRNDNFGTFESKQEEKNGNETIIVGTESSPRANIGGLLRSTRTPNEVSNDGRRNGTGGTFSERIEIKEEVSPKNYKIKESDNIDKTGLVAKYNANILAIKKLKELEDEDRNATIEEQSILAQYSGWGGLPQVFNKDKEAEKFIKQYNELKTLLNETEYASARRSTLNSHYTSSEIVKAVWKIVEKTGFSGGRILEPAVGIGNFLGLMPENIALKSQITGVELDNLTGRMTTKIYPEAKIEIKGFEQLDTPDNYYNLVISNVPFGDYKPFDKNKPNSYQIHNYFFSKSIDLLKENGLAVLITSTGTMQGTTDAQLLREELSSKTELIGAIRLPSNTFKNANTKVTTDLIVLRKLRENENQKGAKWQNLVDSNVYAENGSPLKINEYFSRNNNMMLGELIEDDSYFGNKKSGRIALDGSNVNVKERIQEIIDVFPKIYDENDIVKPEEIGVLASPNTRQDEFFEISGNIYQNDGGYLVAVLKNQEVIKSYLKIKKSLNNILEKQLDSKVSEEKLLAERKILNEEFDVFIAKYGLPESSTNARILGNEPQYGTILGLYRIDKETQKIVKSEIFTKRTVGAIISKESFDNPYDALADSLSTKGKVDLKYIASKIPTLTIDEIKKQLGNVIYLDPSTKNYVTSNNYLSGNVRQKLRIARSMVESDEQFQKNVIALEKVQPIDLESHEVEIKIGSPFINEMDIESFANYMLLGREPEDSEEFRAIKVKYIPEIGSWIIGWNNSSKHKYKIENIKKSVNNNEKWGTTQKSFYELLNSTLNNKPVEIFRNIEGDKKELDKELTFVAQEKQEEIKQEFAKWVWSAPEREKRIMELYNEKMNSYRLPEFDGSHLELPGYSITAPPLTKHQKDAVWRIIQSENTLLAHTVGAGKTWTMQVAAMEKKRLGLIKKPLFVVPNHMTEQFRKEFQIIYPNAKLLMVTNQNLPDVSNRVKKSKNNIARQKMLSKIAYEDWDGIIMSHEMFKRIPLSPERTNEFYEQQIDDIQFSILNMKNNAPNPAEYKQNSRIIKQLEKKKQSLLSKLKTNVNEAMKDIVIPFEKLGIDQIFVDEADLFKNLYFSTSLTRISGLSNSDSQRSMDMYMKTQYLEKNIVFATGTPISNTMAEMFTMMRYMDMKTLKENNLNYFDNWINQFGRIGLTVERSPSGNGYRTIKKITSFVNTPELITMFRKFADVKTAEELQLARPKLRNNNRTVVSIEPSEELNNYIKQEIPKRIEEMMNKQDPTIDNMLKLTNDLRHASLDMRLIDEKLSAKEEANKIVAVTDMIYKKWEESKTIKGTQLVFCDLSTPKGQSDKDDEMEIIEDNDDLNLSESNKKVVIYDEINTYLKRKGIPNNEIAFIHDAKTKEQKQKLFDKVSSGDLRILIGSTSKMGAGTNVQERLVALHHLDCPWRPRDIEQREGRILRQGNMNKEVEIFTYVTKDSFDANMWEKIKNKSKIISQALSNNLTERVIEDMDAVVIGYAEAEALASGNPLMAEKTILDTEIYKYDILYSNYIKNQKECERMLESIPMAIEKKKLNNELYLEDIKNRRAVKGDDFEILINGKIYNERKIAKEKLEYIINKNSSENQNLTKILGAFGNFQLKLQSRTKSYLDNSVTLFSNQEERNIDLILVGKKTYIANTNTILGLEYTLNNTPDKKLQEGIEEIIELEKKLEHYKVKQNSEFPDIEKLNKLKARSVEINKQLGIDKQEVQDVPNTQEEQNAQLKSSVGRFLKKFTEEKNQQDRGAER